MAESYDVAIIGSGVAARTVAGRCREAGSTVAVVDERPFGGTCMLRGCDPKKILRSASVAVDLAYRLRSKGVDGIPHVDWRQLMAFKRDFTEPIPPAQEEWYRAIGAEPIRGRARFISRNALSVDGREIEARRIVLANGAEPVPLPVEGAEHVTTSDEFLDMDALPRRILLIGGGYIAAEFSHIAAAAGAKVTILQRGGRLLETFDADMVAVLAARFRDLGIEVMVDTNVVAIERRDGSYAVRAEAPGTSGLLEVETDLVVHAAGRAPDFGRLGLDEADIQVRAGRLVLNDYLQSTSNAAVYAAGDAAGQGPPLTPVASLDGSAVAENVLRGNVRRPDYSGIPSVAFTIPPIAMVGLSEQDARSSGRKVRMKHQKASDWFLARQSQEPAYAFKTLVEEETERILGAHLVGPGADEVINIFALAIRQGLTASQIKDAIWAYPTASSDVTYML